MYSIFAQLLQEKGVSALAVSKATGIPYTTFADWKSGRSRPKADKLSKIAEYFDVSVDYLLGIEKTAPFDADAVLDPQEQELMSLLSRLSHSQKLSLIPMLRSMLGEDK